MNDQIGKSKVLLINEELADSKKLVNSCNHDHKYFHV